ncbi:MAG: glycine cleavage system aminomethyltransferase GcvT [Chthonomonadales bacterium]|nr:glycine cleavage system aminomethyltransferase GcvT [Chthonomonadales bacterium]
MGTDDLRRTPLWDVHRALGARMVPFAGWEMPVQYAGILDEARAVRRGVGLFDISHMGRLQLRGDGATDLLERLTPNDVGGLAEGQAHYSLLTNEVGGIRDDIIIYREGGETFLVVVNASNRAADLEWLRASAPTGTELADETEATAMIAVQGPGAAALLGSLSGDVAPRMPRFAHRRLALAGVDATCCRTGYTGEDGFELIMPAAGGPAVWEALRSSGGVPCGLGARDALRIEAGFPLYGHEIDETTTPVEAGLMWVVKLDKGPFVGRDAIAEAKRRGAARRLMGLVMDDRAIPRQGYTLYVDRQPVGNVTSGVFSPARGRALGMAYVEAAHAASGTRVEVEIRGSRHLARLVPKKSLLQT